MIVVSDTSPLNYLILIGQESLLPKLFGNVVIPQVVFDELRGKGAPSLIIEWSRNLPAWIQIKQTHLVPIPSLDILDRGEREAILLVQELSADLLVVDDKQARMAAADLGIEITGTVGIIDKAARMGLIDLRTVIDKLQTTNFFISADLIKKLME
ncbi:MAG: DUF3368 domain-containing protein [Acidobacteria bacterium]|nr:DUF3368 domain-containing protein [Acidobacteriota bacterium]